MATRQFVTNVRDLLLVILLLGTAGCAHQTVHDYCVGNLEHYSDYKECYAEESASRARGNAASRFLKGFADGYNARRSADGPRPVRIYNIQNGTSANCQQTGNNINCY